MSNRETMATNNRPGLKYKQSNFVILELFKDDGEKFNSIDNENLKLICQRGFQVGAKKSDELDKRIVLELKVGVINDDSDVEEISDEQLLIRIKTVTNFKLEEESSNSEITLTLMVQANIQTTDIINLILRNSEFVGGEIPYDF